jgi:hypothetical protein
MIITVELIKSEFDDLLIVDALVNGKRQAGIKRAWCRNEFHEYFDSMWDSFGKQIKKMTFDVEFNDG